MTRAAGFSFIGVSLIGGLIVHHLWGFSSLILFAAGMALSGTISLMWASLSRMGQSEEMSLDEALSFSAPSATEEQKRAVLRTLKDLEYELHVGKISQTDFEEVSADVRKKAKALIAQQDEDMDERLKKAEERVLKFKNSADTSGKKSKPRAKKKTPLEEDQTETPIGSPEDSPPDSVNDIDAQEEEAKT